MKGELRCSTEKRSSCIDYGKNRALRKIFGQEGDVRLNKTRY
jgi:hypothetical protein